MIIENTKLLENILNPENMKLDSAQILSFALELPDFNTILSDLQGMENAEKILENIQCSSSAAPNITEGLIKAKMELIKNLQLLAEKDKVPVKRSSINDIRLFINSQELNPRLKIDMDSLSKEDIDFFKLCSEQKEITVNDINAKDARMNFMLVNEANQVSYKSINFSKGLFNLIEYSFKKQKPIRLDFRGNSSVILKVTPQGRLSAEFIANDAAMEYILKSNIPNLKHKFDTEEIPYEKIFYRENSGKNKKNKGGKK